MNLQKSLIAYNKVTPLNIINPVEWPGPAATYLASRMEIDAYSRYGVLP